MCDGPDCRQMKDMYYCFATHKCHETFMGVLTGPQAVTVTHRDIVMLLSQLNFLQMQFYKKKNNRE